ncbi:serine/threonine-protein kinase bud32 [Myotisia sp. PD_48]|nr:serine/threonine-protein kinase bud32 [Myotisia sp. PD_48]
MSETPFDPPLPSAFTYCDPEDKPSLLAQGAEARLYKTHFLNPSIPAALKVRPSKPYRHPTLDGRLTKQRVLQEARCLTRLVREGVPVPGVLAADWGRTLGSGSAEDGDIDMDVGSWLLMEWIEGEVVRQVINKWEIWAKSCGKIQEEQETTATPAETEVEDRDKEICALLRKIGSAVGLLHKTGITHGDLTTSNLMLRGGQGQNDNGNSNIAQRPDLTGEIVLIDFGLAGQSFQDEDRAVDLYVLERAFSSSHPRTEGLFGEVLAAYGESFKGAKLVLTKLEEVRRRGRKRSMVG